MVRFFRYLKFLYWHIRDDAIWCKVFGHPGVVWYNPAGLEPDMHCTRCSEYLG